MRKSNKTHVGAILIIGIITISFFVVIYPKLPKKLPHTYISQLTGKDALNNSEPFDVKGTDLGIIVKYKNQYRYIFGDTFGGGFVSMVDPSVNVNTNWRSNVMAYSSDTDPSDGINIDGWISNSRSDYAKELIDSRKDSEEMTCIPTTAYTNGDNFYIYYMSVHQWGLPGEWTCNNASIAYSTDGISFTKMSNISWAGNSNFTMFGIIQEGSLTRSSDQALYILATPAGRFGNAYLMKVPKSQILNQSAYRYYSGVDESNDASWTEFQDLAIKVFDGPIGELSAMWNPYLKKYVVMYYQESLGMIVIRTAKEPWGPWSNPIGVVSSTEYPGLYGGFIHPDFVENDGQTMYFVFSLWGIYNSFVMKVKISLFTVFLNS